MKTFCSPLHLVCLIVLALICNSSFAQKKPKFTLEDDTKKVKELLKRIDKDVSDTSVYSNDVVHMAQGSRAITNKQELAAVLKAEASAGTLTMTHELITINSYPEIVVTRGRVTGAFLPKGGGTAFPFETNNVMTFKRTKDGGLRIWQVIFNRVDMDAIRKSSNPFHKFFGEWTLKGDDWSQNWGGGMEHIKIPGHHTVNREVNTANSMLSVIDGAPPHGHIFWTYNPVKKTVGHLSSFGDVRIGVGSGSVDDNGDVSLKVSFEGEAEGTYRLYSYKWVSADEYELKSVQYNAKDEPTGLYYGGTFVRIK
jgi:ketosteroid isomerase-like protein